MRQLVYSCVFKSPRYLSQLKLLLHAYKERGATAATDYLIICNPELQDNVVELFDEVKIKGDIWPFPLEGGHLVYAYAALYEIFSYSKINNYDKILYLDCDILITESLENIFTLDLDDKLYAVEEGHTCGDFAAWYGGDFFGERNPNTTGFSAGLLLFKNSRLIKQLFKDIKDHIHQHVREGREIGGCYDQPFCNYHALKNNLLENQTLIDLCGDRTTGPPHYTPRYDLTLVHFPGPCENHRNLSKTEFIQEYWQEYLYKLQETEE